MSRQFKEWKNNTQNVERKKLKTDNKTLFTPNIVANKETKIENLEIDRFDKKNRICITDDGRVKNKNENYFVFNRYSDISEDSNG